MKKINTRLILTVLVLSILLSGCTTAPAPEPETTNPSAGSTPTPDYATPDAESKSGEPEEPEGEVELTMAVVSYMDYLGVSYMVGDFNNQSDKYKITIKDYSDGDEYDVETARMRLNVDIGSGNVPDLIRFGYKFSPYTFISHGYLLDMLPLIDADEDMSRDDISILKALTKEGGLYFLSDHFGFTTGTGKYLRFGDRYGWTFDEYLEIQDETNGEIDIIYNMTKENFIEEMVSRYVTDSIDWTNGICDLNNDQFIALLEAGNKIKERPENIEAGYVMTRDNYPSKLVANGKLIMNVIYFRNVAKLAYEESIAGERFSYIGFPTIDGSNGSDISISPFGICSYTANPKGCWAFMKYILTEYGGDAAALSVYKPKLLETLEKAKVEVVEQDNAAFFGESVLMTDEDVERFLDLLEDTEHLNINDNAVMSIVTEEAMAYFDGKQTAERAAELIQSRVQIYVSEQS